MPENNLILFFGRLHPLFVHLPIGFLSLLAAVELASRFGRFRRVGHARGIILAMSAASAAASVLCGLMLSTEGGYDADLLAWHKWLGIALASEIVLMSVAFAMRKARAYAVLLVATMATMVPASHMGGSMTHGKDYLTEYAPAWLGGGGGGAAATTRGAEPKFVSPEQARVYQDLVGPIIDRDCLACHGAEKSSGGLRLDSVAAMLKGGKAGPAVVARDAEASPSMQRMRLPAEDPKHMPPAGKPQPSLDQQAAIRWWINVGLPEGSTVGELHAGAEQLDLAARVLGIPVRHEELAPLSLTELPSALDGLGKQAGALVSVPEAGEPWIAVNASVARKFDDAGTSSLGPVAANIVMLNLARTEVTDASLAIVGRMGNLRELRLDGTAITDAGLANLAKLRKLEYLNLYNTRVSDAGLESLVGLPSLRRLYLWQTRVTPAAAERFAREKSDPARTAALEGELDALKAQIARLHVVVETGVRPATTMPASRPVTRPARRPASTP